MDSSEQHTQSEKPHVAPVAPDERAVLTRFLEHLRADKTFEADRNRVRVVPRGLFVDEKIVPQVVERYQKWFFSESKGLVQKSLDKCHLWLFESHTPERLYLVEGKNILAGYVIAIPLKNPQQFGLPFYLGSLLSTAHYIHPADPEIQAIKGIEVRSGSKGLEFSLFRRKGAVVLSEQTLREFFKLAGESRFLQRRYPEIEKKLPICLKALVGIIKRAREVSRAYPMIVPFQTKTSKTNKASVAGKFLIIEDKGRIFRILELNGRHLSDILRHELTSAPREKLGSFRLTPKQRDIMGFYEVGGRRTSVHARAFSEFCELIRRSREPREKMGGWFTAAECFERFSSTFQLSQPIEKFKISKALERFGITGDRFRINEGWIFVLSRENTVMRTVAKHIRLAGHKRG